MNPRISLVFLFILTGFARAQTTHPAPRNAPENLPEGYRLLYHSDLSAAPRSDFVCSDPAAWGEGPTDLHLLKQSAYKPPVRSPRNIAIMSGWSLDDFVLEAEMQSTGREYGHLDMCLFFGVQSRDKFYYAHIAQAADDHAHNLFRVDGKPRIKFATKTTKGIKWGKDKWHKVRLVRDSGSGRIEVYFDDMKTPIMVGEDRTFTSGNVGFGSFDDTGRIRNIAIWGKKLGKAFDLGFVSSPREIRFHKSKERCRVELGGKLFAEYRWDERFGPLLHPVIGPAGKPMTRSWPVGAWKAAESKDHPHHRSLWFAHGDVNGLDFWSGQDGSKIVQTSIQLPKPKERQDQMRTTNDWLDSKGRVVCRDSRTLTFSGDAKTRILDFDISITASEGPVHFGETKEGTMAIRMHTLLRLRGKHAAGHAIDSKDHKDDEIWGKRARWVAYWAPMIQKDPKNPAKQRNQGIALLDHPDNQGHPCHWHARDYGLLAANPFGSKAFGGNDSEGFHLAKGKILRLRYRFVFFAGPAFPKDLDGLSRKFAQMR